MRTISAYPLSTCISRLTRNAVRIFAMLAVCVWATHADASPSNSSSDTATDIKGARLTVLFDAFGDDASLQKDWGYSALVEIGGRKILFDTGNDPAVFEHNVKAKGVDLKTIDCVVLSHRHSDHMGGLAYVLSVNPTVKIYAPKENFGIFGSSLPSSFFRKSETLSPERRYYSGNPPEIMKFGTAWPAANIELIDKTQEIAPGLTLIALISDKTGTLELKELSLAIKTRDGMVLIVGCSHPGIDRIVEAAASIDRRIHMIAGGFHLATAPDNEIERLVTTLHDAYHVQWIAPGHCTGEPAFAAFMKSFGDHDIYAGLGTTIDLASPHASLHRGEQRTRLSRTLNDYHGLLRDTLIHFGGHARNLDDGAAPHRE